MNININIYILTCVHIQTHVYIYIYIYIYIVNLNGLGGSWLVLRAFKGQQCWNKHKEEGWRMTSDYINTKA